MTRNMDAATGTDGSALTCHAITQASNAGDYVAHYGCLYSWNDAMKACPAGWHLPTFEEFDVLLTYVDTHKTSSSAFLALIPASTDWVDFQSQGGDDFGFSALSTGTNCPPPFSGPGKSVNFWSSTATACPSVGSGCVTVLYLGSGDVDFDSDYKFNGNSVRCLRDAVPEE